MKKIAIFNVFIILISFSFQALAQDKAKLEEQLRRTMSKESPMTEDDIKTYITHCKTILHMSQDPQQHKEALNSIGKWSEARYAYVTTKVAVGMSLLVNANDARNASVPDFTKPTKAEMDLLTRYRDDLARSMEAAAK